MHSAGDPRLASFHLIGNWRSKVTNFRFLAPRLVRLSKSTVLQETTLVILVLRAVLVQVPISPNHTLVTIETIRTKTLSVYRKVSLLLNVVRFESITFFIFFIFCRRFAETDISLIIFKL